MTSTEDALMRLREAAAADRAAQERAREARHALREQAMEAMAAGAPAATVARVAGVGRPIVYRWRDRIPETGGG